MNTIHTAGRGSKEDVILSYQVEHKAKSSFNIQINIFLFLYYQEKNQIKIIKPHTFIITNQKDKNGIVNIFLTKQEVATIPLPCSPDQQHTCKQKK